MVIGAHVDWKLMLPPEIDAPFPMGVQVPQLLEKHRMVDANNRVEDLVQQVGSGGDPWVT